MALAIFGPAKRPTYKLGQLGQIDRTDFQQEAPERRFKVHQSRRGMEGADV
jgi:hypothetical protein